MNVCRMVNGMSMEYSDDEASAELILSRSAENVVNVNVCRMVNGMSMEYSDDEASAELILSRFAQNAGLGLTEVMSNYSQYADAIQQSFTAHCASMCPQTTSHRYLPSSDTSRVHKTTPHNPPQTNLAHYGLILALCTL